MSKIHTLECKYNVFIVPSNNLPLTFQVSGTITGWGNPLDGEMHTETAISLCELESTCKHVRETVNLKSN